MDLIYTNSLIESTVPVCEVIDFFKTFTQNFIAIVENERICGIVCKDRLTITMASKYGWALYANKPISSLMDPNPLICDGNQDITDLLRQVVLRPAETVYDDIIVSVNDIFAGLVSVKHLMISQLNDYDYKMQELQYQQAVLQKTISSYLLDQNVKPEHWQKKVDAIVITATNIEKLEEENANVRDLEQKIKLQGMLDAFSVIDLVQLFVQGMKTGLLEISAGAQYNEKHVKVYIYFSQGTIFHAEDAQGKGVSALFRALKIFQGCFTFYYDSTTKAVTIEDNPMALLLEACKTFDEETLNK
jgi:hypothetical protein